MTTAQLIAETLLQAARYRDAAAEQANREHRGDLVRRHTAHATENRRLAAEALQN